MIWGFAGISGSFLVAAFSVNQLHATVPVYRLAFSQRAPRNTRPLEVGGVARFDCVGSTQEFTCCMGGLTSPPAITPAGGRPARCTVTLPGDTGSVGDVAPHRQQVSSRIWRVATSPTRVVQAQITQRCTRYVAMHPLRSETPDQKGCNAYGSGAPPHRQQALSRIWRSTTSPPRVLQAKITQQCTRYNSNALDRRALHYLLSSAMLR